MNTKNWVLSILLSITFGTLGQAQHLSGIDSLYVDLSTADANQKSSALLKLADYYQEQNNLDTALYFINQALDLAKSEQHEIQKQEAYFYLGNLFRERGEYQKAITNYQLGVVNNSDELMVADIKNKIGVCYYFLSDYKKAIEFYLEALTIYQAEGDALETARILSNIGLIYHVIKDFDKAISYYERSAEIYKANNEIKGVISQLVNTGTTHQQNNNDQQAMVFFQEVLNLTDTMPNYSARGTALHNLAGYAVDKGEYDKALNYMLESLKIDEYHGRHNGVIISYLSIGILYTKAGEFKKAEEYLLKSWELADTLSAQKELMEVSRELAVFYNKIGEHEKAFHYLHQQSSLKDSIYNIEQTAIIQDLREKYETEKQEQQIESLNRQNALQKKLNYWSILFFVFAIGGLSLLLYNFWLRKRIWKEKAHREKAANDLQIVKNEKLETEISYKNRELSSLALHAYQKNELLTKIQQKLAKMKEDSGDPTINLTIDKVIKTLSANIELDKEWDTFILHFESVHPNFFNQLQTLCPKLSQVELKQCVYIKINLSSKEIARLLNINNSSVHVAHYRIKKKLNLDSATSLQEYIQDIS